MSENSKLDELDAAIVKVFDTYYSKDENGNYFVEVYPDPHDDTDAILNIIKEENISNLQELSEITFDSYGESEYYALVGACETLLDDKNVKRLWREASSELADIFGISEIDLYNVFGNIEPSFMRDYIMDFAPGNFYVKLPDFSDMEICVDIDIDTGDMNSDFTANNIYPHYSIDDHYREEELEDIDYEKEASLFWLAGTQGFSKQELLDSMIAKDVPKNDFLKSVFYELYNSSSWMNQLVFLVKMPLSQYFECSAVIDKDNENAFDVESRSNKGFILVNKETVCGLHDFWNGAGGGMDIQLQNDVKIPLSCISGLRFEGSRSTDALYGIRNVYGVGAGWWDKGKILELDYETPCTYTFEESKVSLDDKLETRVDEIKEQVDGVIETQTNSDDLDHNQR